MASFAPSTSIRKRSRTPPPSDCSMEEDFSNVATDGSSDPPSFQVKSHTSSLTADKLQASSSCAAVSPFLDFRSNNNNTLMLSQSSSGSSVTFDSGMELESPQKQHRRNVDTIFDVCFITDANNDNHSSVSMESPMRNCSMSFEPARKKPRSEGVFEGLSVAVSHENNASVQPIHTRPCCCHVCGSAAVDVAATPKSATSINDISGEQNHMLPPSKTKTLKSHSLLNYFPSKPSKKPAAAFKPVNNLANCTASKEKDQINCNYCDKSTCSSCVRPCEQCGCNFCTFCSKVDYGGVVEQIFCFECVNDKNTERNESFGSDVDMMDL